MALQEIINTTSAKLFRAEAQGSQGWGTERPLTVIFDFDGDLDFDGVEPACIAYVLRKPLGGNAKAA